MAMQYEADVYCGKKCPYQIWTQFDKEVIKVAFQLSWKLSRLHSSCHGNLITNKLARRNVADAFISKNLHSKYKLKTT